MKKVLFLLTSLLFASAASYATSSPQTLTLQGAGSITFPDPNTNSASVEPSINEYSLSPGNGDVITDSKDTITYDADDDTSIDVVQWVQTQMAQENIPWKDVNMVTYKGGNTAPDSLSFALKGVLSFSQNQVRYQCNNIIFGQGKSKSYSPWYIFTNVSNLSEMITNYQVDKSTIIQCSNVADTTNAPVYFRFVPNNDSTFNVTQVDIDDNVNQTVNTVCFSADSQRNLQILNFSNENVNVTPGENYNNTVKVQDNCLKLLANQKNSYEVKNWVETQMTSRGIQWTKNNMCSAPTKGETPDQLEIAFQGDLQFSYAGVKYTCNNLIFGKGYQSWNDVHPQDWWAFSNVNSQFMKGSDIEISCTNNVGQQTNLFLKQPVTVPSNTFIIKDMIKQCKQQKGNFGSCTPSLPSSPGGGGGDAPPVE